MENNKQLIQTLLECARVCEMCASACLSEKDVTMLVKCIQTDLDCAATCKLTATLLQNYSPIADKQLEVCATICKICADECEKHSHHMEHCKECALVCRKCEEACHAYV